MKIKIGNIEIENNVFLAPMAGVTDQSFRAVCAKMGAGLTYSEMISAKGLSYKNKNTKSLLDIHEYEKYVGIQLFGRDENILADMAQTLDDYPIILIDINMGCPAPKITKNFEGSALMREPEQIGKIVNKVSKASKKPVTIKIRKGFDEFSINAVEIAKIAEYNGAAAITIHGRTREQYYSGKADWDIIKAVKKAVKIPVIGNGDITDGKSAKAMFEYTECDGIMIGRAAGGNPWIFREVQSYLEKGVEMPRPSYKERIETALLQARMTAAHKGEDIGIKEMRKHFGDYIKGMPDAAQMRNKINKTCTYAEAESLLYDYLNEIQ